MNIWTDNETINIQLSRRRVKAYLKAVGLEKTNMMTVIQAKEIFLLMVADFKCGKLSTDELAVLASGIYLCIKNKKDIHDAKFMELLRDLPELPFYTRQKKLDIFVALMRSMWKYIEIKN